jgi:4-amino-4-deoxy-L-arabinose transferase-like glycosyltransferase
MARNLPLQKSPRSVLWLLIPLAFGIRLIFDSARQLVPDEAFYWVLSRHLAAGYLDHPPMVAYVIRAGTFLFGFNELGVRALGSAMAFGAVLVLAAMCRRTRAGERGAVLLGVIWVCSPLFAGIATIITPDTPMIFFSMCAMAVAVGIARRVEAKEGDVAPSSWALLGLFTGLGMISKYTAVLPAAAIGGALVASPAGRAQLRRAGPWMALLIAVIVFWPVVHWNATHGWASFKFQLHHGLDEASAGDADDSASSGVSLAARFASLGIYVAGQAGFYTPVFFIFGVVAVAIRWREYRSLGLADRILTWSATVPLVFFGLAAFKSGSPGEGNWPAFGYFPMSLLTLQHVARLWKPFDVKWLKIGAGIALAITAALHSPEFLAKIMKDRFPRKLNEFYGWREMGRYVNEVAGGIPIIAGRHQDAAELAFYMPGQPEVWVITPVGKDGKPVSRPTAYDYFANRPNVRELPEIVYFNGHQEEFRQAFEFVTAGAKYDWRMFLHGQERNRRFEVLRNIWVAPPASRPSRKR